MDELVIVSLGYGRDQAVAPMRLCLRIFTGEAKHIGNRLARSQHSLAAGEVLHPVAALFPPRDAAIQVQAPWAHRHAGLDADPRLHGIAMEDELVDAFRELKIAQRLQRIRVLRIAVGVEAAGVRLGTNHILPAEMPTRNNKAIARIRMLVTTAGPELSHRQIGEIRTALDIVWAAVGFEGRLQTVSVAKLGEVAVIVVVIEVRDGSPHVPQEPFGHIVGLDHTSGQRD